MHDSHQGNSSPALGDLDLHQLRAFLVLARTGSYTEAARRLHRTQPAVSHAIRKLEVSAGVALVERRGRGLKLTEEGQRLLEACATAFDALEAACEELRLGGPGNWGRLRVGATVEFGCSILMKHVTSFAAAHPGLDLQFRLSPDLKQALLRDDIDLAVDCSEHCHPELVTIPLFRENYAVVCAPALAARIGSPADLKCLPLLSLDPEGAWWQRLARVLPPEHQPRGTRFIAVDHIRGMANGAAHGLGVALLPRYAVLEELEAGSLVSLFPGLALPEDSFRIYQKRSRSGLAKLKSFTEWLRALQPSEFGVQGPSDGPGSLETSWN